MGAGRLRRLRGGSQSRRWAAQRIVQGRFASGVEIHLEYSELAWYPLVMTAELGKSAPAAETRLEYSELAYTLWRRWLRRINCTGTLIPGVVFMFVCLPGQVGQCTEVDFAEVDPSAADSVVAGPLAAGSLVVGLRAEKARQPQLKAAAPEWWTGFSVVRRVDVEVTVFVDFEDGLLVETTTELVIGGLEDLL
ncbi:hypothetical protein KC327_g38 [Hortaea werneckii]|nr:hypothetical protein KC327_g38 [Hortaea werneckii]